MPDPDILDLIARKEQELRARLLAARTRADAEVAEARGRAARLRADSERAARAEIEAWRQAEIGRVRQLAAASVSVPSDDVERDVAAEALSTAVEIVVSAVLPGAIPVVPERPLEPAG